MFRTGSQVPSTAQDDTSHAFNADDTLIDAESPLQRRLVRTVSVLAVVVYALYLVYRLLYTINRDALIFSSVIYFAELHGFFSLCLYFHSGWTTRRRRVVAPPPGLKVDVFITTYDEDVDLLRKTVRAALAMRYPHRTYILDDGRRPAVRMMASELGCLYLTRSDNKHAKAGNWNNAFRLTDGDVIATFDADHVPRPEFLERTLGFFADPRVALVQVPQQFHNLDSVQHHVSWQQRRMSSEQDAFFNLVMPGKDNWNAAFFCGTGAVLRRTALEPLGGIMTDTITEDLHTSIVLHSQGWKSVYLNEVLVTGIAPSDLKAFETQRLRWAQGNLQVARFANPLTVRGLTLHQRIAYAGSLYHWTIGIPKLFYYIAPPIILFTGTFPIAHYDSTFLAIYLTFLTTLVTSYMVVSRGRGRLLLDELYNMVSFFTLIRALQRVFIRRRGALKFEVTQKKGSSTRQLGPVLPHLGLLAFSIFAIVWSALGLGFGISNDYFGASSAMFWTSYNMVMLVVVIRIATRPAEKRNDQRFRANFPVEIVAPGMTGGVVGVTVDVSEGGCSLLWPAPLTTGARVRMRIHLGATAAVWDAIVRAEQHGADAGWHRYGIQFERRTQADIDLLNDVIYMMVVPHLFATLSQPAPLEGLYRVIERRFTGRDRARARRHPVQLPVRLYLNGVKYMASALDLSASGMSILTPATVTAGQRVRVSLCVPSKEWTGEATVARVQRRFTGSGFEMSAIGLRFESEDQITDLEAYQITAAA